MTNFFQEVSRKVLFRDASLERQDWPVFSEQTDAVFSLMHGKHVCRSRSVDPCGLQSFDILEMPDTAANRIGVVSYRNSFKRIATSTTISITSLIGTSIENAARTNFSLSMQHLRSEITAATLTGLPLFFRLPTRNQRSTLKALPVYMGVA